VQRVSAWMVLGLFGQCVRGCLVARHCLSWWCWIYLAVPYVVRWHMWLKGIRFSTNDPFFVSLFLFSLLLDFCTWPFKFSKHSFNLLFIWIWSLFFLLLFGLFRLIYKLSFFFQFHHPSIFSSFKCGSYFFIAICFVWDNFWDLFYNFSILRLFFL